MNQEHKLGILRAVEASPFAVRDTLKQLSITLAGTFLAGALAKKVTAPSSILSLSLIGFGLTVLLISRFLPLRIDRYEEFPERPTAN